jgi:hypothetical protein
MARVHANNFITTLNGAISDSATSIVLTSVTGFPIIGAGTTCNVTLANGSDIEIVTATARSSFTLTVTRGAESTVAKAFASGSTVSIRPTAGSFDGKADLASPTFTGTVVLPSTTSIGTVSSTELGYVDGVTSAIQTQIDLKAPLADPVFTGSLQLPNSATPTVNADGEIALDTTITDHKGLLKYYSGQEMVVVAMPTANLISTDTYVVAYDAGTDSFHMTAGSGGGGTPGGSNTQVQYNNAGAFGGITGATTNGTALTLVAPILGTPASGNLSNCTAYAQSALTGLGTGVSAFLATPSSANLITAVTDETGSGVLVFNNTPTFITPLLGTPTSGALTNCTSIPVNQATGTLPIANGGTAVTSVTTAPTASSFAGWDANSNLSFNSGLRGYATTATAAGTTTLVVGSKQVQYFTGSTTQTVVLPVVSTLVLGQMFRIVNNSSGAVTVQSSGANTIIAMNGLSWAEFTVIAITGTGVASWDYTFGTNASTLYIPQTINANRFLATGGSNNVVTGIGNTANAIPKTNSSATIAMAAGTANQVLNVNSGATDVAFTSTLTSITLVTPALGTPTSGVLTNCTGLPVAGGGSGRASTTAYAVICGGTTSTGAEQSIASLGAAGAVLTSAGTGALPSMKGGLATFAVYLGTNQTIATATHTKAILDTSSFNTGGYFDTATNYRFTPLVAGKYFFVATSLWTTPDVGSVIISEIYVNGSGYSTQNLYVASAGGFPHCTTTACITLNGTTDYVEMYVYHTSVASKVINAGVVNTFLSGFLVEPT